MANEQYITSVFDAETTATDSDEISVQTWQNGYFEIINNQDGGAGSVKPQGRQLDGTWHDLVESDGVTTVEFTAASTAAAPSTFTLTEGHGLFQLRFKTYSMADASITVNGSRSGVILNA